MIKPDVQLCFFFNAFDFWSWIAGYYYLLRSKIKCISNLSRFSRWLLGFYFEAGSKISNASRCPIPCVPNSITATFRLTGKSLFGKSKRGKCGEGRDKEWLGMEAVTRSKSECISFSLKRLSFLIESFISPFCNHCGRDFRLYSHSIRFLSRPLVILGNKTLQKTL